MVITSRIANVAGPLIVINYKFSKQYTSRIEVTTPLAYPWTFHFFLAVAFLAVDAEDDDAAFFFFDLSLSLSLSWSAELISFSISMFIAIAPASFVMSSHICRLCFQRWCMYGGDYQLQSVSKGYKANHYYDLLMDILNKRYAFVCS